MDLQSSDPQGSRLALDPSSQAAFRNAVTRLEQTLVQEIESKSRGLLDLMRVTRSVSIEDLDGESIDRLKSLRAILDENQRVITNHLVAAREISDVLAQAMESVESDGTYSERIGRERKG